MFDLSIKTLEHGWADIEITINGQVFSYVFEYTPNDPLADIVQSALRLVFGNDSEVVFWNHPNKETLRIENIDNSLCRITAKQYSQELPIKKYASTVLKMFDRYIYAHSKSDYERGWQHPFPSKDIEKLRADYGLLRE